MPWRKEKAEIAKMPLHVYKISHCMTFASVQLWRSVAFLSFLVLSDNADDF